MIIVSGFNEIKINGIVWVKINNMSDDLNVDKGLFDFIDCPCCVCVNKFNEYTAVKNIINPSGIIVYRDWEIILVVNIISLIKFREGGAAILIDNSKNHHIHSVGLINRIPFVKNVLRVCVILYVILAKINNAEDLSPCAIIIIIAPAIPHVDIDIHPEIRSPICLTDE